MRHPPRALRDNALKACCVWVEPDSSLPSRSSRMTTPSRRQLLQAVDPVDDAPMAPVRPKPGGSPAKTPGSPAKETGSGAKESGKVSKENPSANWAFSMGYDDPAQKPASPRFSGAAPRGGAFGDRTTLSVVSDNRKKKSRSYGVICWSTGLLFVRRTLAVMAGLVPAIHAGPPQERVPPRRDRQEGGRSQGFSRLPA